MNLQPGSFEWNKYALATTGFFIIYLVLKLNLIPQLPNCTSFLSCPPWYTEFRATVDSFVFIVGGISGLKASRSFGGRKNFTGRLLFYFSLLLFATFPVYRFLVYLDVMPNPLSIWLSYTVLLPYSGIDLWEQGLVLCFPAYALVVSLRSVWDRLDSRSWVIILLSSGFALFLAWFNLSYADPASGLTTFPDAILNVWITPSVLFVQLAAGGLLWRSLGRWYVAKSIRALIVTYLFVGVVVAQIIGTVIFTWLAGLGSTNSASSFDLDAAYYYYDILLVLAFYLFSMVLTQIRPRVTGRYF